MTAYENLLNFLIETPVLKVVLVSTLSKLNCISECNDLKDN